MRVELPDGYVPPEPTHPLYGYLTPEELEAYEAQERDRLGIVPSAPPPGSQEAETAVEPVASPWAPVSAAPVVPAATEAAELPDFSPASAQESTLTQESEEDELTVPGEPEATAEPEAVVETSPSPPAPAQTGWVPPAPPLVEPPVPEPPAADPVIEELTPHGEPAEEYRWDAYRQTWVPMVPTAPARPSTGVEVAEEPPPDHAAAAGGRGASSSWTSADGQRFRWDARTQEWIVEGPERPA